MAGKRIGNWTRGILLLIIVTVAQSGLNAYPNGIASRTLKITTAGCGDCHGSSASGSVIVSITGPDTVLAGQGYTYTINVTGGSGTTGGINIATSSGRLDSISTFLKKVSGELVHKQKVSVPSTYQFLYTAPASQGSDTIFATAKGAGFNSWNWMPNKRIVVLVATGVNEWEGLPSGYSLYQNFPNPFNPVTKIGYFIPAAGAVKLKVYNTAGKEMSELVNEIQAPGNYEVEWDASNMPSGIYFYRISAGRYSDTKKMILVR